MSETAIGEPMYRKRINQFRRKIGYGVGSLFNRKKYRKAGNIKFLSDPKISFGFMCKNIIKNRGYKQVNDSFKSIYGQSNDVIVVDNDSEDSEQLKSLCKKYGFRFFSVKTNPKYDWGFDISRVSNKIVLESKNDIFVRLTPDIIYPNNFGMYISTFFENHDPKKNFMAFRMCNVKNDKTINKIWSFIWTGYRPHFIKARGWDERLTYFLMEDMYAHSIMLYVFGCQRHINENYILRHINHKRGERDSSQKRMKALKKWDWLKQIELLKKNVNKYNKNVENSQW